MRRLTAPLLFLFTLFLVTVSCEKEMLNELPDVVVVNNQVTIKLPLDSLLLSGSFTDDDTSLNYLWTKLTGDGSITIEHPDSLATWVKGLKEGEYSFKFTVTDNNGGVGQDTVFITVEARETTTVTINPDHNPTEVHLFGDSAGLDQTDPDAPEILAGSGTYYSEDVDIRAILKFDLSSIPQDAVIASANLTLYSNPDPLNGHDDHANSGPDNSFYIKRVTDSWDPTTINWLNQPSTTSDDAVLIPHTDEAFKDLENIDVKDLVSKMVSTENNGFIIQLKNENPYNFRIFCSSKFPDETKHPKLVVSYYQD
jgi:hypothetical protein